jgi:hypothetical protein
MKGNTYNTEKSHRALMVVIYNANPSAIAIVTVIGNWQSMAKTKSHSMAT